MSHQPAQGPRGVPDRQVTWLHQPQQALLRGQVPQRLLGAICLVVLCVLLSLGLWPFHAPGNEVTWVQGAGGLAFGRYGTVLGSQPPEVPSSWPNSGGTIELWVEPNRWDSGTILSLYQPKRGLLLALRQSLTDLEVVFGTREGSNTWATEHFYADDAFALSLQQKRLVFVTVTTELDDTKVYLNGTLARTAEHFLIPQEALGGRVILGDSPRQPDSFRGLIRGLAIYDRELNADEATRSYRRWQDGRESTSDASGTLPALFLFKEGAGNIVHNLGTGGDLRIPQRYTVIDKIALEPFWSEFNFSRGYWSGNLKNIVGFIPWGVCFYAFWCGVRPRQALWMTLLTGALISLTIEVLQAPLPTRDSGTTDIITNTLGTWVGVICYRRLLIWIDAKGLLARAEP